MFPQDWTVDNLWKKHKSRPYNPLIANTLYRAGYIESWGRGIEKMKDSCLELGILKPEIEVKTEDFMIKFEVKTTQTTQTTQTKLKVDNKLNEIEEKIIKIIEEDGSLSQKQIAERTDLTHDIIKYYTKKLKENNVIKHIGTNRKGK
nr:ATP-binding protein [Oceanivirga salmonicida]